MAEEVVDGQSRPKGMPISAIFSLEGLLDPGHGSTVVSRVLNEFSNLPRGDQNALRSAVNEEIIPTTGGFRRGQAGRALGNLNFLLQEPVQQAVLVSDVLSTAILRCWAESHAPLREEVERHLASRGMESPGLDPAKKQFPGVWLEEDWRAEQEAFSQAHEGYQEQDVSLMLCYVSGKFPLVHEPDADKGDGGAALSAVLTYLRELPPTATEWEREIPDFAASVSKLIEEKAAQLRWSADFDAIVGAVRREFAELMQFFETDTQRWKASRVSHEVDTSATLKLADRLQSLLAEYLPIHDRALGISEERERSRRREELQPSIIDALREIDGLMVENSDSEGSDSPENPENPEPDGPATLEDSPLPETVREAPRPEAAPVVQQPAPEREPSQVNPLQEALPVAESTKLGRSVAIAEPSAMAVSEHAALQSENLGLRNDRDALRAENQSLRDEVEALKAELYESQEMEESWRLAYLSSKEGREKPDETTAIDVENVNTAVEMAKARFKKELTFAPNSESSIESNPFIRPEKVWEALQWLATTYYKSKMGQLRVTNFDQSIKEACGWWYKSDQGETTVSRYKKSYTAHAYGKTYRLEQHIGKGTNFDARYTIRIAFDWDDDLRQVIVGYIGRHQQTDAS